MPRRNSESNREISNSTGSRIPIVNNHGRNHEYTVPGAAPDSMIPVIKKHVAVALAVSLLFIAAMSSVFFKSSSSPHVTTYLGSTHPVIKGMGSAYEIVTNTDSKVTQEYRYELGIHEIQSDVVLYRHIQTGATFLSIIPIDDKQDEVLGISFPTKPTNNRGTAHVLQRSIINSGGSVRFPVKHPLHQIQKGSLQTFAKSITTNDHTTYLVASRNQQDMYNHMTIYMDLVFQPLVVMNNTKTTTTIINSTINGTENHPNDNNNDNQWIFRQEGWRLEMDDNDDKQVQPKFNGVVYKERKNTFSNPEELLLWHSQMRLFNNAATSCSSNSNDCYDYRYNSLGDPNEIVHLTLEELQEFYQRYYHPSNALFSFYGSKESMAKLLDIFDDFITKTNLPSNTMASSTTGANNNPIPWSSTSLATSLSSSFAEPQQEPHALEQQQQRQRRDPSIVSIPYPSSSSDGNHSNNKTENNSNNHGDDDNNMYVMTTWVIPKENGNEYEEFFFHNTDYYYSAEENLIMDGEGQIHNLDELIQVTWKVLDELLMSRPRGILYKALIESNLGSQVIGNGLNQHNSYPWMYHVGLSGIRYHYTTTTTTTTTISSNHDDNDNYYRDTTQSILDLIHDTLNDIVQTGILPEDIDRAINTVDFQLRDLNSGDVPRGYPILMEVIEKWNRDYDDPFMGYRYNWQMDRLKTIVELHGSELFVDLIRKHFLVEETNDSNKNKSKVTIELYPSHTLQEQNEREEHDRIMELERGFEKLLTETSDLKVKQSTDDPPDVLASIPRLSPNDIMNIGSSSSIRSSIRTNSNGISSSNDIYENNNNHSDIESAIYVRTNAYDSDATVVYHEVSSSSDIIYADFGLDISGIDVDDIVLLQLFERLLVEAGTDHLDDVTVANTIGTITGGIKGSVVIEPIISRITDENGQGNIVIPTGEYLSTKYFLRGSCNNTNVDRLFDLFRVLYFERTEFLKIEEDQDVVVQMLKDLVSEQEKKIRLSGDHYGQGRVKARYSIYGFVMEQYDGISTLQKLREILEMAIHDWRKLCRRLNKMKDIIVNGHRNGMVLNLTGEKSVLDSIRESVKDFVTKRLPPYPYSQAPEPEPFPDFSEVMHPWVSSATYQLMQAESPIRDEGIVVTKMMATQDGYVARGGRLYQPGEIVHGSSDFITQCIENNVLFDQVQMRLGARKVTADLNLETGLLLFSSDQDSNIRGTLDVYESVGNTVQAEIKNNNTDGSLILLDDAPVSMLGSIADLYGSEPQSDVIGWKSVIQWLSSGITPNFQQQWQDSILSSNKEDFVEYANRLQSLDHQPSVAVIASSMAISNAIQRDSLNLTLIYI